MSARVLMLLGNYLTYDSRVKREARALASAGHDVTVAYVTDGEAPGEGVLQGTKVLRCPLEVHSRFLPPGARWLRYLTSVLRFGVLKPLYRGAREVDADVVHAHDLQALPVAARIARERGCRLVLDVHDLWVETRNQIESAGTPIGRIRVAMLQAAWRNVERRLLPRADHVLTASPGYAGVLRERYGVEAHVVRNCPEFVETEPNLALRKLCGLGKEVKIILYVGGLLVARGLIRCAETLKHLPEEYVLVCVGPGDGGFIREAAERCGTSARVHILPPVPPGQVVSLAAGADVGLCLIEPINLSKKLTLPNKLFEYMMAGIPQVITDLPEMRRVVDGERVGAVVPVNPSPKEVAAALRRLCETPDGLEMGERAREAARERHNWGIESGKLIALYEKVLGGRSR